MNFPVEVFKIFPLHVHFKCNTVKLGYNELGYNELSVITNKMQEIYAKTHEIHQKVVDYSKKYYCYEAVFN